MKKLITLSIIYISLFILGINLDSQTEKVKKVKTDSTVSKTDSTLLFRKKDEIILQQKRINNKLDSLISEIKKDPNKYQKRIKK